MANWVTTEPTSVDCAYIRNGGGENFKVEITTTNNPLQTSLTGSGTKNNEPIHISVSNLGLGKNANTPIYTELSNVGTENNKPIHISVSSLGLGKNANTPIYTYLSNIGTKNDAPIYVRTSMPITEFTANIALQIYSWSNSMTTDGKQSIGNARRAAQDAFVRAEEFVKQLIRENYIKDIKNTNGLVVWRTDNKIM